MANCYTAIELGVEVLPVLNKSTCLRPTRTTPRRIEDVIGIDATEAVLCSAKTGLGVEDILEAVIARVPPPQGDPAAPLKALIIDSWFDNYVGVVMLVRVIDGELKPKDKIRLMSAEAQYLCDQVGVFTPKSCNGRRCGRRGGLHHFRHQGTQGRPRWATPSPWRTAADGRPAGFKEIKPSRSSPASTRWNRTSTTLRESLEKLKLNDASLQYEPEVSQALGFGFRCGFLGLLAHGDRAGAPGAGIRPGSHHHGTHRRV